MATFLISILAALGVVIIITLVGLILAQVLINRADKTQTNIITEQSQCVVIDIDDLPEVQQEPGITVISNDVIESTSHRHHHLKKKTISVIDQDALNNQINNKNTTMEQTQANKDLLTPSQTYNDVVSSNTSIINPLTDKITLEY
jgi:hypothetical protein